MSLKVKISDYSEEVLSEFKDRVEIGLEEIGVFGEDYAVAAIENFPRRVDTGLLRNSITHALAGQTPSKQTYQSDDGSKSGGYYGSAEGGGNTVYIGTNVDYAGYVHDGTRRMEPNRFLEAAIRGHKETYAAIMERALRGEIGDSSE